ncbi:MAG: hypothetical protein ACFFCH_11390 [Promethearchaeota archaeon]
MRKYQVTKTHYLILQAFLFCGLGCLLIGAGMVFPFSYFRYRSYSWPPERFYIVTQFSGQVTNETPVVYHFLPEYGSDVEALEIRDFYTNGDPVNLLISSSDELIESYYNFSNTSENPLNLFFNDTIPIMLRVEYNNTPATFSSWLFLRFLIPPPVASIVPDYTPIIMTGVLLIFGFILLILGSWRWLQIPLSGNKPV